MKAILQPIHPEHCAKILCGVKTVELRTKIPKIETPYKVYVYCTKHGEFMVQSKTNAACFKNMIDKYGGKVIGEYICKDMSEYRKDETCVGCYRYDISYDEIRSMCLTGLEIDNYGRGKTLYGMHISDLVIYDKPKELSEFMKQPCVRSGEWDNLENGIPCLKCYHLLDNYGCDLRITRPPQSWCYVEEVKSNGKIY